MGKPSTLGNHSLIEGISRPRVGLSFISSVVDTMITILDAASIATTYWLNKNISRKVSASTDTNLLGVLTIATSMLERGKKGFHYNIAVRRWRSLYQYVLQC
ncbi:MAG: hypothetical protein KAG53_12065 [Endozoicomonadaceae bacterium]|nr:hypothetical protein [Endozoicomonadaceae bacterium]